MKLIINTNTINITIICTMLWKAWLGNEQIFVVYLTQLIKYAFKSQNHRITE